MTAIKTPSAAKQAGIPTETYLLPSYWASALVNNDTSGTEPLELAVINSWLASTKPGRCVDADVANAGFHWHGDDTNERVGCDRCEFTFAPETALTP